LYINDTENSCADCTVKLFADDNNFFVYGKTVSDAYYGVRITVSAII